MLLETLLQRLREFFVDVTEANVTFHLGDLFDPSHFRLRDVFLKTELINALHMPFELKAVYIGDVKVEGVLGFVAGTPLTIGVDNVCVVLGHKPVDWNNELALRYARELLLTILQSIPAFPMGTKPKQPENGSTPTTPASNDSSFSLSPVKWIINKVLTTIAETTIKLERLHIRFESEYEGQLIAYGAQIPTLQLSTSDLDEPVLRRREQPGITYPADSSDHHKACKRLYLANIALYCDLHATSYLGPSPPPRPVAVTTPRGSAVTMPSATAPSLTLAERLAFMRQQCLTPLAPSTDRDLVLISALWLKLDFVRGIDTKPTSPSAWGLGAVDIVTEEIKINVDFTQLAALSAELARVTDFVQREQRRAWRPSSVDREQVSPLQVTLSASTLLPVLPEETAKQLTSGKPPRMLNRAWLHGMWRYAAHCVLVAARKGDARRVRLGKATHSPEDEQLQREADHERYKALYARSLSDESLRIVLFGRNLLPASPRATDTKQTPHGAMSLPAYEPLTRAEQWELSDLVERLAAKDERLMRREVTQRMRREYASHQSSMAAINASGVSTRALSIEIPGETTEAALRTNGASISPKHSSNDIISVSSPANSLPASLPPDFLANHHHHTRSRAGSSPAGSPTKHNSLCPPSPTSSMSSHPHLTHSASAPIARHKAPNASPTATKSAHFSFRSPPSPTNLSRQQWLIESLLPAALLLPSRVIPLVNWHIGPVSVRLHHRTPAADNAPVFPAASSRPSLSISTSSPCSSIPPRLPDSFMEFYLESCTGCALLAKVPSVSFLVELRLGLVRASLVDFASSFASASPPNAAMGNTIRTDYIREPSDGFLYLGLKYNFKHATRVASLLAPVEEELWDVKAKLCVGTIHIEYNDMALQTAMRTDLVRRPSLSGANLSGFTPISDPLIPFSAGSASRLDTATYVTVVHDVLTNWKTFLERVQPPKPPPSSAVAPVAPSSPSKVKQLKKEAAQARVTKLLNAFLHHSSCVDVDVNGIELQLSVLTSKVVERMRATKDKPSGQKNALPLPMFDSEQVHIMLPSTGAGLQNRPLLNECQVHAGGARVTFRTTKQGRAAVIDHVLQRVFPTGKHEPEGVV